MSFIQRREERKKKHIANAFDKVGENLPRSSFTQEDFKRITEIATQEIEKEFNEKYPQSSKILTQKERTKKLAAKISKELYCKSVEHLAELVVSKIARDDMPELKEAFLDLYIIPTLTKTAAHLCKNPSDTNQDIAVRFQTTYEIVRALEIAIVYPGDINARAMDPSVLSNSCSTPDTIDNILSGLHKLHKQIHAPSLLALEREVLKFPSTFASTCVESIVSQLEKCIAISKANPLLKWNELQASYPTECPESTTTPPRSINSYAKVATDLSHIIIGDTATDPDSGL